MLFGDIIERHLLGLYENFRPHFMRLDSGFACDCVEHELEGEAHAGSRHAAIGQNRAFVRGDRVGAATIGGKIVRTRQDACHLRRLKTGRERIRRIGARIDGGLAIDAKQPAIPVGIAGYAVMVLAAIGAMHCRAVRISRVTLIGASNALSMFTLTKVSRKTLSPQSSCSNAEPLSRAASMS